MLLNFNSYDFDHLNDVMCHDIYGRRRGKSVADAFSIVHRIELSPKLDNIVILNIDHQRNEFFKSILSDVVEYFNMSITKSRDKWIVEDTTIVFATYNTISFIVR